MRQLILLNALIISGLFAPVADAASPSVQANICRILVASLPASGTRFADGDVDEQIAARAHAVLDLHPVAPGGLELRSVYGGSAGCQSNQLVRITSGTEATVDIGEFAGGEGEFCHGDEIGLVTVDGRPALLETDGRQHGRIVWTIAPWAGSGLGATCVVTMTLLPRYGIRESYCPGIGCGALADQTVREADLIARQPSLVLRFDPDTLPVSERSTWQRMADLDDGIDPDRTAGVATLGQDHSNIIDTDVGWDQSVFAPRVGGRLLFGTIGTAGFGSKYGEDKGATVYALENGDLRPVAGFYLHVVGRVLEAVQVHDAPRRR